MLQKVGFKQLPGKGSHTNWIHPLYSGKDGNDAKPYQEKEIRPLARIRRSLNQVHNCTSQK